jgi:transcriptional regulator with XRE-family HTH domain
MTITVMTRSKSKLNEEDAEAAIRLRHIWLAHKKQFKCSQEDVASKIGISQGAFAHYMTGYNPLGIDITIRFANYFNVPVSAIRVFDSFEKCLADEIARQKLMQVPDEDTMEVVKMMASINRENKGRIRGKIEAWIEMMLGVDKIPEPQMKDRSNFDRRSGTR